MSETKHDTTAMPGTETEVKVYKASRSLQAKVGNGAVAPDVIEKVQKNMDANTTDFQPVAQQFLDQLAAEIAQAAAGKEDMEHLRANVTRTVMQLKANGAMFGYALVGELANTMMNFLESVTALDKDILAILEANHKTLSAIVRTKMKGDGGAQGALLKGELEGVCRRYLEKKGAGGPAS